MQTLSVIAGVVVGHDKVKIMRLIREMDVKEPIEQLLAQLTK